MICGCAAAATPYLQSSRLIHNFYTERVCPWNSWGFFNEMQRGLHFLWRLHAPTTLNVVFSQVTFNDILLKSDRAKDGHQENDFLGVFMVNHSQLGL
jgi:hypothetical protein